MKFMLMMSGTKAGFEGLAKWTPAEFKAHVAFMKNFNKELVASGEFVLAEGSRHADERTNRELQEGGGGAVVTDGPFAETKEFLAGFWIIDVESKERAIAIAAAASAAPGPGGTPLSIPIELRQAMQHPEL